MNDQVLPSDDEEQRDSEALYISLVENLPVSVARKDLKGRITFANQAFCELLGLDFAQLSGKTDYDLYPKELADKYRRDDLWVQTTGKTFSDVEQNVSGGQTHYFEVRKTPVRDTSGRIIGTQVIFWDVSAHKRTKAELDQERQLLNALLANTPDNIYFKDREGCFIRISQAKAKRLCLNHPADAVGKSDSYFFPEAHAAKARADEIEVMRTGRSLVSAEEQLTWPDDTTSWVSTTKAPLRNFAGEIVGTFGISRDITGRKLIEVAQREAKEAAEAANRAKGAFLAHMSHEIRTPLNAILGLTELTLDTPLNPAQRDYLQTVLASAESLLGVINQILDFSKIDAQRIELEQLPFDLPALVVETTKSLEYVADEKSLGLTCDVAESVPHCLVGDPTRVRQVLVNLIGNAIKFTDQGRIGVRVDCVENNGPSAIVHFVVCDTGIGIPRDKLTSVFEEFQQADSSTTRQYGGTGLGLAICARMVELMGGRIWVESELGRGSAFQFTARFGIPSPAEVARPNADKRHDDYVPEPLGQRPLRILLADDGAANQKLLCGILHKLGHNVQVAMDGCEAVERYSSEPFDLVLMDVQMPEMDGLQATREIRRLELRNGRHVPIVAITAHASEEDERQCREVGMDAYLRKPVRRHELLRTIADLNIAIKQDDVREEQRPMTDKLTSHWTPAWNQEAALAAVDGDQDLLKMVIQAFLGENDTLLKQIQQSIQQRDFVVLRRAAHTLKGSTRIFGDTEAHQLAQTIEQHAMASEQVDYEQLAQKLEASLKPLVSELEAYIGLGI